MQTILIVFHMLLAVGIVGLVLMQHGKGADAGAAFGSGASATVFGSRGSANFLSRATGIMAALFFATSITLAFFAMQTTDQPGLMDTEAVEEVAVPAETPADIAEAPEADTDLPPLEVPVEIEQPQSDVPEVPVPSE
ncbi:MAG: preprotein translocase subunit SecG [Pseudomonadota bacterium]